MMNNIEVNVVYPWTGIFIDTMVENTLGAESHSSGCGCGERDMQFTLPNTLQTHKRINLLKQQQGIEVTIWQKA